MTYTHIVDQHSPKQQLFPLSQSELELQSWATVTVNFDATKSEAKIQKPEATHTCIC